MIIIGIVGSPAGGKSTVAKRLRELGATWVNADRLAHRALKMPLVVRALADRYGTSIIDSSGQIDRQSLARIVFGDDAESRKALDYLESVVHPVTRHLALRRLTRAAQWRIQAAVLDAPLLLDADWGVICDQVWCVDAPERLRCDWIKKRNWNLDELRRRERRQLSIAEKRRLSTRVIENDRSLADLLSRVDRLWIETCSSDSSAGADEDDWTRPEHCLQYSRLIYEPPSALPSSGPQGPPLIS